MSRIDVLERVRRAVRRGAYLVSERPGPLAGLPAMLRSPDVERWQLDAHVDALRASGAIGDASAWSARGVIAAHPRFGDYEDALRFASLQEQAALTEGGEALVAQLASVARHRGVIAFLMGRPAVALEHFTDALSHERSAENLANALAALLADGDASTARELLGDVRAGFPPVFRFELEAMIDADDDLAALR